MHLGAVQFLLLKYLSPKIAKIGKNMQKPTILLIDDNPLVLESKKSILKSEGYNIVTVENGKAAIKKLNEITIDLVITDLIMEDGDGIDVLKKAKELNPQTMVIILTGYGDIFSAINALRHDADDYLLKPCEVEEMIYRIDQCFKKQRLLKRTRTYENILPVCCECKKIRDDSAKEPEWLTLEDYLKKKANVGVTHTY